MSIMEKGEEGRRLTKSRWLISAPLETKRIVISKRPQFAVTFRAVSPVCEATSLALYSLSALQSVPLLSVPYPPRCPVADEQPPENR